ncbi:hypothetical protein [Bradyrhizobium manausense]|uniref:hypothetical protein n=1 Tax=Bradyrhizobium manausense TaxID=989370 RepID=UPI002013566C|nr:hypothetical protein [Bradyrhizobium manausense]
MSRAFRSCGAEVAGPVGDMEDALRILHDGSIVDAAVLDVNIRNEMIFPIAQELRARHVPFVFTLFPPATERHWNIRRRAALVQTKHAMAGSR